MKLDKKKYILLKKIMQQEPLFPTLSSHSSIGIFPQNRNQFFQHREFYEKLFKSLSDEIRTWKNITFVSDSVRNVFDSDIKVATKLWELRNEVSSEIGMLLMSGGQSYLYFINNSPEEQKVDVIVFVTIKDTLMSFTMLSYGYGMSEMDQVIDYSFDCQENELGYHVSFPVQTVVTFLLFKEYAELETKIIQKGKQKRAIISGEKYVTELDIPVEVIDSTWFTTLIKSDAFKVSGHFRLQPYGKGLKQKKLIWIDQYVKSGVVRKAKMLKNQK